ncbi:MAG: ankyrin repeat domain-containing protein [Thermoanaerobaculia bacterium]
MNLFGRVHKPSFASMESLIYQDDLNGLKKLKDSGADLSIRDTDGSSLLMVALAGTLVSEHMVRYLIAGGNNIDVARADGWTALHQAVQLQDPKYVEMVLSAGAKVDPRDRFGNTPLWRATTKTGSIDVIKVLLRAGADPRAENNSGVTPLVKAQQLERFDLLSLFEEVPWGDTQK